MRSLCLFGKLKRVWDVWSQDIFWFRMFYSVLAVLTVLTGFRIVRNKVALKLNALKWLNMLIGHFLLQVMKEQWYYVGLHALNVLLTYIGFSNVFYCNEIEL